MCAQAQTGPFLCQPADRNLFSAEALRAHAKCLALAPTLHKNDLCVELHEPPTNWHHLMLEMSAARKSDDRRRKRNPTRSDLFATSPPSPANTSLIPTGRDRHTTNPIANEQGQIQARHRIRSSSTTRPSPIASSSSDMDITEEEEFVETGMEPAGLDQSQDWSPVHRPALRLPRVYAARRLALANLSPLGDPVEQPQDPHSESDSEEDEVEGCDPVVIDAEAITSKLTEPAKSLCRLRLLFEKHVPTSLTPFLPPTVSAVRHLSCEIVTDLIFSSIESMKGDFIAEKLSELRMRGVVTQDFALRAFMTLTDELLKPLMLQVRSLKVFCI